MDSELRSTHLCRRTHRGAKRCDRVKAVATELFLAQGYDGVSLDTIIARAGGSKTNIYSHFGGKEGLFLSIIEGLCDQVVADLEAVELSGTDLEEGLRRLGRTLLHALLDPQHLALYRLVIGQAARFPGIGQAWTQHGPDATRRMLGQFFACHRPRIPDLSPEEAAMIYHDMLAWNRLNRAACGIEGPCGTAEIDQAVEAALALFARGYIR